MIKKTDRIKFKNDLIFISVLFLTVSVIAAGYFFLRGEGDTVIVTVGGKIYGEYPICENRTVEIRTENTENILLILDGKVYMEKASCPDGICAKHRPVFRDGESIICLPNQVVIRIASKNEDSPDVVV